MGSSTDVLNAIDSLENRVFDVEEILKPLLENGVGETTKKMPLLDRAKLNVAVLFALESLIFSCLKANGIDPKDHPVRKEIDRLKRYHEKLQEAEQSATSTTKEPSMNLNKQAAARMIQHALAGNNQRTSDLAQKEREARERVLARMKQKLTVADAPFPTNAMPTPTPTPPIPQADPVQDERPATADKEDFSGSEEGEIEDDTPEVQLLDAQSSTVTASDPTPSKRLRKRKKSQLPLSQGQSKISPHKKAEKKARKKAKKEAAKSSTVV